MGCLGPEAFKSRHGDSAIAAALAYFASRQDLAEMLARDNLGIGVAHQLSTGSGGLTADYFEKFAA